MNNCKILTNSRAVKINVNEKSSQVESVIVENNNNNKDLNEIKCNFVVNCAGLWANSLGVKNGLTIPNQAAEHYYLITEPFDGVTDTLPIIEDQENYGYYREQGGGLFIGYLNLLQNHGE